MFIYWNILGKKQNNIKKNVFLIFGFPMKKVEKGYI